MKALNFYASFGAVALASLLVACAPTNSQMGPAPQQPAPAIPPEILPPDPANEKVEALASVDRAVTLRPKVDVLFVIDTSESMKDHQENLKKNVDRFVEAFEARKEVDFHIGVVSVFDSRRYGSEVPDGKYYPLGLLRPLKDPAHPGEVVAGPQFVTRAERYNEVLGETLKVGIERRCGKYEWDSASKSSKCVEDLYGPEYEESFTPVMAALNEAKNPGFYRSDAHLAIIMITDANDDSAVAPGELENWLRELKGGDSAMYSTFGVLALKGCKQDPGGPPDRILDFLKKSRGEAYNLCDANFGKNLAKVGETIRQKASARVKIELESIPDFKTLKVTYGGVELKPDARVGWTYDANTTSIVIGPDVAATAAPDAQLRIEYDAVDLRRVRTGRIKPVTR